jgi:hypothetical protein
MVEMTAVAIPALQDAPPSGALSGALTLPTRVRRQALSGAPPPAVPAIHEPILLATVGSRPCSSAR